MDGVATAGLGAVGGHHVPRARAGDHCTGVLLEDVVGHWGAVSVHLHAAGELVGIPRVVLVDQPIGLDDLELQAVGTGRAQQVGQEHQDIARHQRRAEREILEAVEVLLAREIALRRFGPERKLHLGAPLPRRGLLFAESPSTSRCTRDCSARPVPTTLVLTVPSAPVAMGALRSRSRERVRSSGSSRRVSPSADFGRVNQPVIERRDLRRPDVALGRELHGPGAVALEALYRVEVGDRAVEEVGAERAERRGEAGFAGDFTHGRSNVGVPLAYGIVAISSLASMRGRPKMVGSCRHLSLPRFLRWQGGKAGANAMACGGLRGVCDV